MSEYTNYRIRHMIPDDLDELTALHEEYLNYGEGVRPHFYKILRDFDTIAFKYMVHEQIVGLLIYTKGLALSGNHKDLELQIQTLIGKKSIYTGDALIVRKDYRKRGIGDQLYRTVIGELHDRKVSLTLNELWVHPDGLVPAHSLLFRMFKKNDLVGRYHSFYRDFHHYGYLCPICGQECVCGAEIFLSELPDIHSSFTP